MKQLANAKGREECKLAVAGIVIMQHGCACNWASSMRPPVQSSPVLPPFNLDNGNRIRICFNL